MYRRKVIKLAVQYCFLRRYQSTTVEMSTVIVEHVNEITTIGINRPEKRNCVNVPTAELLKKAIADFENDPNSTAAVLYGVGGNFCAGYDLGQLSSADYDSSQLFTDTGYMGPTHRFIKKPMIAAVSGYAVAGGFELSLMCDMRVMEENAIMGVFCRRFGVPLADGGTVRLPAILGLSRALDVILTGRPINADEAFKWGLANRVVKVGTSLGQAINLAQSLAKFPQACLLADRKSAYNACFSQTYDDILRYERENARPVLVQESIDGAKKFISGVGRHGSFRNLTEKAVPAWEADETKSKL